MRRNCVDDSDDSMLKDSLGNYYIKKFTPVPTVQDMMDMMDRNFRWSENGLNKPVDIWVPFHFLPAILAKAVQHRVRALPATKDSFSVWTFDENQRSNLKLLCQPNSFLVKRMIMMSS